MVYFAAKRREELFQKTIFFYHDNLKYSEYKDNIKIYLSILAIDKIGKSIN